MAGLFRSPLRVYLALALLSLIGIWSAFKLPVSLFPNSSKPFASLCIGSDLAPEAFLKSYGESIESQIRSIRRNGLEVEQLVSTYRPSRMCYKVEFKWGGDDDEALREMETIKAALQGRLPQDSRDRISLWGGRESGGFLALSFYSNERSLTELYKILEPVLIPKLSRVADAQEPSLYNPQQRQIQVELRPESLATFQLLPNDVGAAILAGLESYSGGSLSVGGQHMTIEFPRAAESLDSFKLIPIPTSGGRAVTLGEIAHVDLAVPLDSSRVFKTSGSPSVILFVSPKPGGNVKSMAEEVRKAVEDALPALPADIQYRVIVDPSEFIRSAVSNVGKEVGLAAGLAVLILFLFVGNLKNVVTAAIEIPLSIVLAFILMKVSGMNLNLVSLGGLALSAGMNVDASVVVMENIFRHFEKVHGKQLSFEERLSLIVTAVNEVRFSVIASTIASLVVFIPLAFTSELSYAILGDLAKAVVFSHGFSAIVALVLVPTIRLHLMKNGMTHEQPSIFEKPLQRLEATYARALGAFLDRRRVKYASMAGLAVALGLLVTVVAPKLPREIIGKPDTDWVTMSISTSGNTVVRQMDAQAEEIESQILASFGDQIAYTFSQVNSPQNAFIMLKLKNKRDMEKLWKDLEGKFPNTPTNFYYVDSWNPAEMPLPDPPDFKASVRGTDREAIRDMARELELELNERKLFTRISVEPGTAREESLSIRPRAEQMTLLGHQGVRFSPAVLSDLSRTALEGRTITRIDLGGESMDIFIRYPEKYVGTPEDLGALPIGAGQRILPLRALADLSIETKRPSIRRENGREAYVVSGRGAKGESAKTSESVEKAGALIESWPEIIEKRRALQREKKLAMESSESGSTTSAESGIVKASTTAGSLDGAVTSLAVPTIELEDAKAELTSALKQLAMAVSLSIVLIFLTMVFQFGSVMNSLLVLVAVPLGFIGVVISLFVFQSTLSLNSLLGVILLNGLSVANSIILVDFLQRKVKEGVAPRLAAIEVGQTRLRPILMTSLTTGLGMLPIALGLGEGGKILQPLGIAVAGGLLFSMLTTLFVVPALQVSWLEWLEKRGGQA